MFRDDVIERKTGGDGWIARQTYSIVRQIDIH